MNWKGWIMIALAGVSGTAQAVSITGLFSTGVDNAGKALTDKATDQHYTIIDSPISGAAKTPLSGFYPLNGPYWLADQATSRWIAPWSTINGDAPAGTYTYRTTFVISGDGGLGGGSSSGGPNPEVLSGYRFRVWGRWTSDDVGLGVYLNGNYIGGTNADERPWAVWQSFDTGFTGAMFREGVNTLDFKVENAVFSGRNPTGLQTQVYGAFQPVPEPATVAVLGAGILIGLRRRRSRRPVRES